jgi:hypothetical protein
MDLLDGTKMLAGYTLGVEPSAREHLVVVVKGTFDFPKDGGEATLAEEQVPFVYADTFTGKPGFSAPVDECDFAFRKPRCDVLLNGSAYAPDGKPTTRVTVGLKVGPMRKVFDVVGERVWSATPTRIAPEPPRPFARMPITYDRAFGGLDDIAPDKSRHSAYMPNPVGSGYHKQLDIAYVDGTRVPNTEERKNPVTRPDAAYRPMSFGPVGRGWHPRLGFAGTYDQNWLDNVFPFLPADFKDDYYQPAPADQQIPYPKGGEEVMLVNLTPEGRAGFRLPVVDLPIVFVPTKGEREERQPVIDAVLIEPDQRRLILIWRASRPLRRNIFEMAQVVVGRMPRAWWRARDLGKTYYRSLEELARAKRRERAEAAA